MQLEESRERIVRLLRDRDVAVLCNASVRTVIDWRNAGKLPFIRIGRSIRYRPESLAAALEKLERGAV
jgi:excisionase family DNA binding protein